MTGWGALAIVPAFGLDTLAVAAGLGAAGLGERRRLAVTVALFEGGMPVVGVVAGTWLGRLVSGYAVWVAAALLVFLGLREIAEGWRDLREQDADDDRDPPRRGEAGRRRALGLWGLLATGIAVSMDELGAGLAAGAARFPLGVLAPALALQAVVLTYAGLRAGALLQRLAGRYGEIVAGAALVGVGVAIALGAR